MDEFLLCFQCGKVYDENDRIPMTGSCKHLMCFQCHSSMIETFDCPICNEENSFFGALRNDSILQKANDFATEMKETLFKDMIAAIQTVMKGHLCSKYSEEPGKPRICMDCAQISGIMIKKKPGGAKGIVKYFSPETLISSIPIVCEDCVYENHNGHKTILLSNIENLEIALGYEYYLKQAERSYQLVDIYQEQLEEYHKHMKLYELFLENDSQSLADSEAMSSELKNSVLESEQRVSALAREVRTLKERELKLREDHLVRNVKHLQELIEQIDDAEEKNEIEICLKKMTGIQKMYFEITSKLVLTEIVTKRIDEEVLSRMKQLEESYKSGLFVKIETSEDSMFYKFQALIQEYEDVDKMFGLGIQNSKDSERRKHDLSNKFDELGKIQDAIENLENIESSLNETIFKKQMDQLVNYRSFLQMELTEDGYEQDTLTVEALQIQERLNYFNLMRLTFFPGIPGADDDNFAFDILIDGTILKHKSCS